MADFFSDFGNFARPFRENSFEHNEYNPMKPMTPSYVTTPFRSCSRRAFVPLLPALMLACIALSDPTHAACPEVCDPNLRNTGFGDFVTQPLTGSDNTAFGYAALNENDGTDNTAVGSDALRNNSNGQSNTATGFQALTNNTSGFDNTATGWHALFSNTIGQQNTASGVDSLPFNTSGVRNTAYGWRGFLPIPSAMTMSRSVFRHWLITPPARRTLPSARLRGLISQVVVTTLISATKEWLARPARSVSGRREHILRPLSPAFTARPSPAERA